MDRLHQLHDAGQSIWLDFIDRSLLRSGELEEKEVEVAVAESMPRLEGNGVEPRSGP